MANVTSRRTIIKRPGNDRGKSAPDEDIVEYLKSIPIVSGLLMKKSRKKKWQPRWYELRGPYLMYWKTERSVIESKKGGGVQMPLQALDIRRFITKNVSLQGAELSMTSNAGNTYYFKPFSKKHESLMERWREQIEKQILNFEIQGMEIKVPSTPPPRPPPLGINDCSGNAVEEVDRNVQGSTKERASVEILARIGSLPQRYAIREMWPESLQVNLVMAESVGTHPQYKLKIFKDGKQQKDGIKARFGAFRDLNDKLTDLDSGRPMVHSFPPTISKQKWGFTLSPAEIQKRAIDMNIWLNDILSSEMEDATAKEVVKFLKVYDERINPERIQYTSFP